jgi:hypothetical protein
VRAIGKLLAFHQSRPPFVIIPVVADIGKDFLDGAIDRPGYFNGKQVILLIKMLEALANTLNLGRARLAMVGPMFYELRSRPNMEIGATSKSS